MKTKSAPLVDNSAPTYPAQYLHITECRSGETWVRPLHGNATLDLRRQLVRWIKAEFGGELHLNGDLMPGLDGDYYGKIMTDGRPPESVVCWQGAGFYLKAAKV